MAENEESDCSSGHQGHRKLSRSVYLKALRQAYLDGTLTVDARRLADRLIRLEKEKIRSDRKQQK
ncbi:hypothetical protein CI610_02495 [invertebrate metagenome]|uniref:Uncharacterized protein n=1 Tax=invertebrate metagenome TaxID=1711999 RepID=A0A2H9T5R7_9ZZZZ